MKRLEDRYLLKKMIKDHKIDDIFGEDSSKFLQLFLYEKGEFLCKSGMVLEYGYFLVSGKVKVFSELSNGKVYLLRVESELAFYGDIEILRNHDYVANAQVVVDSIVLGIPKNVAIQRFGEHAGFLRFLCFSLADRLNTISKSSAETLYLPSMNKVAAYLYIHIDDSKQMLATTKTLKNKQGNEIDKALDLSSSYQDIADQLGVTYRHLTRTLSELEAMGLIKRQSRKIWIKDLVRLKELAGDIYQY